ncbi:MAG: hypothetical protein Q8R79_03730 [Legionellaceae bacterium]|nr:hypothetical protein [Legionellaceae bacterium]
MHSAPKTGVTSSTTIKIPLSTDKILKMTAQARETRKQRQEREEQIKQRLPEQKERAAIVTTLLHEKIEKQRPLATAAAQEKQHYLARKISDYHQRMGRTLATAPSYAASTRQNIFQMLQQDLINLRIDLHLLSSEKDKVRLESAHRELNRAVLAIQSLLKHLEYVGPRLSADTRDNFQKQLIFIQWDIDQLLIKKTNHNQKKAVPNKPLDDSALTLNAEWRRHETVKASQTSPLPYPAPLDDCFSETLSTLSDETLNEEWEREGIVNTPVVSPEPYTPEYSAVHSQENTPSLTTSPNPSLIQPFNTLTLQSLVNHPAPTLFARTEKQPHHKRRSGEENAPRVSQGLDANDTRGKCL